MLRFRSLPVNLPRLLTVPQRLFSSIGRKPKTQVWFPAASEAAADVGKNLAALSCSHGSSRRISSSSGISSSLRSRPVCASTSQQPEAPPSDLVSLSQFKTCVVACALTLHCHWKCCGHTYSSSSSSSSDKIMQQPSPTESVVLSSTVRAVNGQSELKLLAAHGSF